MNNVTIQGTGGLVDYVNQMRMDQYIENIRFQDINLRDAIGELNKAREFIASPEHILGNIKSKHGEIAEVFEVRFGNADKIISGEDPNYSFEGLIWRIISRTIFLYSRNLFKATFQWMLY